MIIEFELQGSNTLHKGLFDTHGLWIKYDIQYGEKHAIGEPEAIEGYKLYSHFSFAFFHTDKEVCDLVYSRLISVLRGANNIDIEGVGYIRKVNK